MASMIKLLNPKLILIWHEHYGNREQTSFINRLVLKLCSHFFSVIIAVNDSLKSRSVRKLLTKKVYVLSNYPIITSELKATKVHGESGKRIVCLANLRPDKDHINLLNAFKQVHMAYSDWSLHLVGQLNDDEYYSSIKTFIENEGLEKYVFIYGSCSDTFNILKQSTIGVLASKSEGLPLALLEYGLAKLPVIATNVGDCQKVISNIEEGLLVEPKNHKVLAEALLTLINDIELRRIVAQNLHTKVLSDFSESRIVESLINIYKTHYK
jgi:glycosyltransferase involved in cell wall biosynthesis